MATTRPVVAIDVFQPRYALVMTTDPIQLSRDLFDAPALAADPRPGTRALADSALGALGIELLHCQDDAVVARMPIRAPRLAHGLLLVLAETVASTGAGLVVGRDRRAFGAELNASWIQVVDGDAVVSTAIPLVLGDAQHVWRIVAVDSTGAQVLESRCTLGVVDAPS